MGGRGGRGGQRAGAADGANTPLEVMNNGCAAERERGDVSLGGSTLSDTIVLTPNKSSELSIIRPAAL